MQALCSAVIGLQHYKHSKKRKFKEKILRHLLIPLLSPCSEFHTSLAQDLWPLISVGVPVIFLPLHSVLLPQPCSATRAQSYRAAPHIGLLLWYGVYLHFSSLGTACAGCLWFSKAKHFTIWQRARYRACHLSFWRAVPRSIHLL